MARAGQRRGHSPELVAIARKMRERGIPANEIADLLDRSLAWVSLHTGAPRGAARPWSRKEDALLRRMLSEGATMRECAARLERTVAAVHMRRRALQLASAHTIKPWSEAEDAALVDGLAAGLTAPEIAGKLGRTASAVLQRAHGKGLSFFEARWSKAQLVVLGQLRQEGLTIERIAARLGVTPTKIKKQLRKLGLRSEKYRAWSPDDVAQIKIMHAQGVPISHIARALNRTTEATYRKAGLLGLSRSVRRQRG